MVPCRSWGDRDRSVRGAIANLLACHPLPSERESLGPELNKGDLMAVVKIILPTTPIEQAVHWNRALLLSTALVTDA